MLYNYRLIPSINKNGEIKAFQQSHKLKSKFRKTKAKSIEDAINKINKFINDAKQELSTWVFYHN